MKNIMSFFIQAMEYFFWIVNGTVLAFTYCLRFLIQYKKLPTDFIWFSI